MNVVTSSLASVSGIATNNRNSSRRTCTSERKSEASYPDPCTCWVRLGFDDALVGCSSSRITCLQSAIESNSTRYLHLYDRQRIRYLLYSRPSQRTMYINNGHRRARYHTMMFSVPAIPRHKYALGSGFKDGECILSFFSHINLPLAIPSGLSPYRALSFQGWLQSPVCCASFPRYSSYRYSEVTKAGVSECYEQIKPSVQYPVQRVKIEHGNSENAIKPSTVSAGITLVSSIRRWYPSDAISPLRADLSATYDLITSQGHPEASGE
ncbi:hypothetical protein GYMLUDRAFT_342124 [Collybiopsis luxurians FD-317 M1]|nr:hypothetical protein GYMLUDRAFT_342124 [Collybiopsis luxurians FD-317 M1]